jgi:hypothetical protein
MIFNVLCVIPVLFLFYRQKDREKRIIFKVLVGCVVAMSLLLIGAFFVPA